MDGACQCGRTTLAVRKRQGRLHVGVPGLPGETAKIESDRSELGTQAIARLRSNAYSPSARRHLRADHAKQLAHRFGGISRPAQIDSLMSRPREPAFNDFRRPAEPTRPLSSAAVWPMSNEYSSAASRRAKRARKPRRSVVLGSVVVLDRAIKATLSSAADAARARRCVLHHRIGLEIGLAFSSIRSIRGISPCRDLEELYGIRSSLAFGRRPIT